MRARKITPELYEEISSFAEFTPAEQECISNKIKKLEDEGKPHDQAIAIAISTCAPDKAKGSKMSKTETMSMGYKATVGQDELVIHRVPIFCECVRGDVQFDREWILQAVMKAKQAEKDGYFPPLHVRHHEATTEANNSVRAAGWFRILGSGNFRLKGKDVTAIYADLVITDPVVRDEIMSKRLPYRSVEIFNVNTPAIDGLALLDHEAPFLELPMLMISDLRQEESIGATGVKFGRAWTMNYLDGKGPVVACFRQGDRATLLFRAESMTTSTKTKTEKRGRPAAKAKAEPQEPLLFEDDGEKKDDDENMQEGDGGCDVAGVVKAIKSGAISIKDFGAIKEAMAEAEAGSMPDEEEAPAPAMPPGGEAMKKDDSESTKLAARDGEIAALRARLDERDKADKRRDDVAEALKRFEKKPLGSDPEKMLTDYHREHGPAAFKAFVDRFDATFASIEGVDRHIAGEGLSDPASKIALKYQSEGADAFDAAVGFSREWKKSKSLGVTQLDEERYVAMSMARRAEKQKRQG